MGMAMDIRDADERQKAREARARAERGAVDGTPVKKVAPDPRSKAARRALKKQGTGPAENQQASGPLENK